MKMLGIEPWPCEEQVLLTNGVSLFFDFLAHAVRFLVFYISFILYVCVSECVCVYVHVHVEVRGQPAGGRKFCSLTVRIPGIELRLPALAAKAFTIPASHQLPFVCFSLCLHGVCRSCFVVWKLDPFCFLFFL